jgi:hypothetical protein
MTKSFLSSCTSPLESVMHPHHSGFKFQIIIIIIIIVVVVIIIIIIIIIIIKTDNCLHFNNGTCV